MKKKRKGLWQRITTIMCAAAMVVSGTGMPWGYAGFTSHAEEKHTVWVVGDSTVSAFHDSYYYPRYGWGTKLSEYLDDTLEVQNLALSGTSSKSFTSQGNYATLQNGIKEGDFLLIGFGHNDEKAEDATRYTDPTGDYQTEGSFAKSLYDNYVKLAQDKGATPVLCTPIVRRTASKDSDGNNKWSSSQLHVTDRGDYPAAIRKLGGDVNVAVVDMTEKTKSLYDSMGPDKTVKLHAWTSDQPDSVDNTHTNEWGGSYNAYLVADGIKTLNVSGLAEHVKADIAAPSEEMLKSNPDYQPPKAEDYSNDLPASSLCSDAGIWKGTAFGNLGGNPSATNHVLSGDGKTVNIAVKNNKGKINAKTDGVAMYYYKVPAGKQFSLSATMKVNSIAANNEVSCGLMARDEMYIDKNTGSDLTLGDYVAAAPYMVANASGQWCCFARKSGVLTQNTGKTTLAESVAAGKSYQLSIVSNSDGYTCSIGDQAVADGFDFPLTKIDAEYVYVGMFASRNADVTFSQIKLVVDGKTICEPDADEGGESGESDEKYLKETFTVNPGTKTYSKTYAQWDAMEDKDLDLSDGEGTVVLSGAKYHSAGYGVNVPANSTLTVKVDHSARITFQGSQYSGDGKITAKSDDADGSFDDNGAGYATKVADKTPITMTYSGDKPATLTFTFGANTYMGGDLEVKLLDAPKYLSDDYTFDPGTLSGYAQYDAVSEKDLKLGTDGAVQISAAKWHSTGYGLSYGAGTVLTVGVPRGATIAFQGSQFSHEGDITVSSSDPNGRFDSEKYANKVSPDKSPVTIIYSGDAQATLTITFGAAGYFGKLSVNLAEVAEGDKKIDVWDFGANAETDTSKYNNNLTAKMWNDSKIVNASGALPGGGTYSFGKLTINYGNNDRLYADNADITNKIATSSYGVAKHDFDDGYKANGLWYCNGTGGKNRRYAQVEGIKAGDTVRVYAVAANAETTMFFEKVGASEPQSSATFTTTADRYDFVAETDGTYKIYTDAAQGKPSFYRIVRIPGAEVTGSVDLNGTGISGYKVFFVDSKTNASYEAVVQADHTYKVVLPVDASYNAVIRGASGYGVDNTTRKLEVKEADCHKGIADKTLKVTAIETVSLTGKLEGFATGYDLSKLKVTLKASQESMEQDVMLEVAADNSFSATLIPGVEYTAELAGVNDYEIVAGGTVKLSANAAKNITVALKEGHKVTGSFLVLAGVEDGGKVLTQAFDGNVTKLEFENQADQYTYQASVNGSTFEISLREGAYLAKAVVDGYSTSTHVVVENGDVEKNLLFVSTKAKDPIPRKSDIYVGYPEKGEANYATVRDAIEACGLMNPQSEDERITVHIHPGTYREQVLINTPYISLVNDTKDQVILTWYYGIGYQYYSADEKGYYNPEKAYDQYEKARASKWGCTVLVNSKATAFRAEGITFESSFNRYLTDEELADGVELLLDSSASSIKVVRQTGLNVTSKAATERATAMAIEADQVEFKDCKFYSSQDTLYTGSKAYHMYFKNCLIEGQTDYVFGAGNVVFDACALSWAGYSSGAVGGYITADRPEGTEGYLFRNCSVVSGKTPGNSVVAGYWGRPWGQSANVTFLNTQLESAQMILPVGWTDMSGATAAKAGFKEYNTTVMDGSSVDVSDTLRKSKVMSAEDAAQIDVKSYFGAWTPVYYVEEDGALAFETKPYVISNGDINTPYPGHTMTVGYSLGEKNDQNDVSQIHWYLVDESGNEELVKSSTAVAGKSYKLTAEATGKYLKVVVTPATLGGKTAAAESYQLEPVVRDGYEDPDNPSGNVELGDGVNIFIAGDSTVTDYSANGMYHIGTTRDEGAWGEFLQMFFDPSLVKIQNYANGGRSTRNFINEGSLDKIAANIGKGDYLFIQFGHNDCSDQEAYKIDRFVPVGEPDANGVYPVTAGKKTSTAGVSGMEKYGSTYYAWDCGGTYKWFLKQYIDVAKEKGAIPVLVTPVARTYFVKESGTIRPHHDVDSSTNKNNSYVTAVKQLGEEEGVLVIDAFELTKSMYEAAYSVDPDPKKDKSSEYVKQVMYKGDSTHNNKLGGVLIAAMLANEIKKDELNIASAMVTPSKTAGINADSQQIFKLDADSIFTAYVADADGNFNVVSEYWTKIGQDLINQLKKDEPKEEPKDEPEKDSGSNHDGTGEDEDYIKTTASGNKYSELPVTNHTATTVVVMSTMGEAKSAAGITGSDYIQVEIDVLQNDNLAVKLMKAFAAQNNLTISSFFDVNVYRVTANGAKVSRLTELKSPMDLMFAVPEGLDAAKYDFGVIRVHDGAVTFLKDTDNDPITISIASEQFSPYAVVYAPKGTNAAVKAGTVGTTGSISKSGSKASPKTADESKFIQEVSETAIADFAQKQAEKQLEQEVADLLITPQANRFPFGIVVAALLAMVAFIGGEVIYFGKKKKN